MKGFIRLKRIISAGCVLIFASSMVVGAGKLSATALAATSQDGLFISAKNITLFFEVMGIFACFKRLGKEGLKPLFVTCSKCCKEKLEVDCFSGCLSGDGSVDELGKLRKLLDTSNNVEAIKAFMAATANAKQIECTTCLGFYSWQ